MSKKEQKPALTAPKWLRFFFSVLEKISPFLTCRLATFLFFTPIRFTAPPQEKEFAKQARRKTLNFKKNKIEVYEWGTGTNALLLVHGWSGRATQVAHLTAPLLEKGYKVYSFDAPAHGNSNGRHTHIIEFADIILEIQKLHPEINSIIGHSMGGAASVYAIEKGLQVQRCVIIGSPASTNWILQSYCQQINVSAKIQKLIRNHLESKFQKQFDELSLSYMVKHISTKGLIVHCKDDIDAPVESAHQIHQNWKNSTLVLTKKLGHRRILKDRAVAQTIIDFLKL